MNNDNLENKMTTASDLMKIEFIKAKIGDRLSHVVGKLKNEAFAEVLVFKGKKLAGIFSPVFATRSGMDMINTKVDKFIRSATCIEEDTILDEIIRKMIESDYNALPVKRNGEVMGVVHIFDLLNSICDNLTNLRIRDINLKKSSTVRDSGGISKAIHILHDNSLRALVVLDEKANPLGVVSHFDIMRNVHLYSHERDFGQKHGTASKAFKAESDKLNALSVYNFIRYKDEVSVISSDDATKAINIMIENKILNLLVKDTCSILRAKNILRHYYEKAEGNY